MACWSWKDCRHNVVNHSLTESGLKLRSSLSLAGTVVVFYQSCIKWIPMCSPWLHTNCMFNISAVFAMKSAYLKLCI